MHSKKILYDFRLEEFWMQWNFEFWNMIVIALTAGGEKRGVRCPVYFRMHVSAGSSPCSANSQQSTIAKVKPALTDAGPTIKHKSDFLSYGFIVPGFARWIS